MSVRTTADEKIDEAKDHIQEAIECLVTVVVDVCYGTTEYSVKHRNKLREVFVRLLDIRESF
jgi:hypothetical protein